MLTSNISDMSRMYQSFYFKYYDSPINEIQRRSNSRCRLLLVPFLLYVKECGIDPVSIGTKCITYDEYNQLMLNPGYPS